MKSKEIKSDIPKRILKYLRTIGPVTYTQLKEHLGISNPVLSYHLNTLKEKQMIEFEKKGRQKFYDITKESKIKVENKNAFLINMYEEYFSDTISEEFNLEFLDKNFERIGKMISALLLYLIFKSMETGNNFTENFDVKELTSTILWHICEKIYDDKQNKKLQKMLLEFDFDGFFKETKKINGKSQKEILQEMFDTVNDIYPNDMHFLKSEAPK